MNHALAISMALMVLSCSGPKLMDAPEGDVRVDVSFIAGKAQTKNISDEGDENHISTSDILVFRKENGVLEAHGRSVSGMVSVSVPIGKQLEYFMIANAPEGVFAGMKTKSEFLNSKTQLSHNHLPDLVMHGMGESVFEEGSPPEVGISLERYVCKVSLDTIVPCFVGNGCIDVSYMGAFLINVCAGIPWTGTYKAGGEWLNRMVVDECLTYPLKECLTSFSVRSLADTSAFCPEFAFYCLPNPSDNSIDSSTHPEWCERPTRLVLEFMIDGAVNYYPIDIPGMTGGCWYHIRKVVLKGPGSAKPDVRVAREELLFTIEITPWGKPEYTDTINFNE